MPVHVKNGPVTSWCIASLPLLLACQSLEPVALPRLERPAITTIGLAGAKFSGTWRESIRLTWAPPPADSVAIRSFTLVRKTDNDSAYDVFARSRQIPPSIDTFYDDATPIGFPIDGLTLVCYRLFAVDTLGRPGDTSAACSLYLAPQPVLDTIDTADWCFRWHSQHIMGSVDSYMKVWNGASGASWASVSDLEFGGENQPLYFSACAPDSFKPLSSGVWYYSLYLDAMGPEHQSLTVGSFNVP